MLVYKVQEAETSDPSRNIVEVPGEGYNFNTSVFKIIENEFADICWLCIAT